MDFASKDITLYLAAMQRGEAEAEARLIQIVYAELRKMAAGYMRRERRDHSLQPTALVNEAYLRLSKLHTIDWQSRTHFFAVCANVMRRILVDSARAKNAGKRGLQWAGSPFEEDMLPAPNRPSYILDLDEALLRLAKFDLRQARIVEMRFFAGLTEEEIGSALDISTRTVKRDWRIAKAWLYQELKTPRTGSNDPT